MVCELKLLLNALLRGLVHLSCNDFADVESAVLNFNRENSTKMHG